MRMPTSTSTAPGITDLSVSPGYKGRTDVNVTNARFDMFPGLDG